MSTQKISIADIVFDAGTQVREAINEAVVTDYAERMAEGVEFPPVVLFHDGNRYYLADGFHRGLAASRNGRLEIRAEVRAGTQQDALWFALGANKVNGQRLTDADRRHAVVMAVQTFMNEKSQRQIAEQIGCSQGFVSQVISRNNLDRPERVPGHDGKTYPASVSKRQEIKNRAEALLRDGKSIDEVRAATGIGRESAYEIKRDLGVSGPDRSRKAVSARRDRMRAMAADGYTSIQIAADLGLSVEGCRTILRAEAIDVPADRAVGVTKRHDSNRIVDQMVLDAENLTADVNLIEFDELDADRIGGWLDSLTQAHKSLRTFVNRLTQEHKKHGQAA